MTNVVVTSEATPQAWENWVKAGSELAQREQEFYFDLGDWWNEGAAIFPKTALASACEAFGLEVSSVRRYGRLARAYGGDERDIGVAVSHFMAAQSMPGPARGRTLAAAARHGWTVVKTRDMVTAYKERVLGEGSDDNDDIVDAEIVDNDGPEAVGAINTDDAEAEVVVADPTPASTDVTDSVVEAVDEPVEFGLNTTLDHLVVVDNTISSQTESAVFRPMDQAFLTLSQTVGAAIGRDSEDGFLEVSAALAEGRDLAARYSLLEQDLHDARADTMAAERALTESVAALNEVVADAASAAARTAKEIGFLREALDEAVAAAQRWEQQATSNVESVPEEAATINDSDNGVDIPPPVTQTLEELYARIGSACPVAACSIVSETKTVEETVHALSHHNSDDGITLLSRLSEVLTAQINKTAAVPGTYVCEVAEDAGYPGSVLLVMYGTDDAVDDAARLATQSSMGSVLARLTLQKQLGPVVLKTI